MKSSNGVQNFWSQIRNYIISAALTILVAFKFYGWQVGSIITFFLVLCFIWLVIDIKARLVRALSDTFEYEPSSLEDYPLLNFNWFQQRTDELQHLGFVHLIDYKLKKNSGFARCLAHPENYCYAEINEVFKVDGESIARSCSISSGLDKDWSLSSINREVNSIDSISYGLWNHPKSVRTYHPNINLEELLHKHLQMRQSMIKDIGVDVVTDVSWEHYLQEQQKAVVYRKKALKQKFLLSAMIDVTRFQANPKSEWLGAYAKFKRSK